MELIELRNRIIRAFKGNQRQLTALLAEIENDRAVFPFNEYELLLTSMIAGKHLTYESYREIRTDYMIKNPNLWIFEISAPRGFGETFAQTFIKSKSSKIQNPTKKLDSNYHGQYDLWLEGIRIEVKASRVVDAESNEPLYRRALSANSKKKFLMNFQQLKPQCCDVFVWMAVFRDVIKVWIMNSREVLNHRDYSKGQHRGNSGNEGQLHITDENIKSLDRYLLKSDNLALAIKKAAKR